MSEPGSNANEALEVVGGHLDKGQSEVGSWSTLMQLFERYGFAGLACLGIAWFANTAIEYEREKMLPALESTAKAIERNTEVIRQLPAELRKVPHEVEEETKK